VTTEQSRQAFLRAFGQEDDITVLTLTRLAAGEPARAATVSLTTQIATVP